MKTNRIRARRFMVQALYQSQMTGDSPAEVADAFIDHYDMKRADVPYFKEVMQGIDQTASCLQSVISKPIDRGFDELTPIERAILLIGTYELLKLPDLHWRIIINEAIELAKLFGGTDSHKFVNSVLDKIAHQYRETNEGQADPMASTAITLSVPDELSQQQQEATPAPDAVKPETEPEAGTDQLGAREVAGGLPQQGVKSQLEEATPKSDAVKI